ncbi:sensory neuron membrane protein 1-like [Culicoides brevitarsis]|uniref:sensory neuron membrane protein 1-like n=1 Tax=Culicoides brevitarsis TaxID=469753 RepID=UPI00307B49EA
MKLNIKTNIDFRYSGVVSAVILVFGFMISFVLVPMVIKSMVKKMTVLTPGSFMRRHQQNCTYRMNFYHFNITNQEEVINGGIPKLEEIGPYVYDIYKLRLNENDDEESDTLTYDMSSLYYYRPDLSAPSNVSICQVSGLMIGAFTKVILETPELINFVQAGIDLIHGSPDTPFLCFNPLEPIHTGYPINCDQTEFSAKAICSAIGSQDYFRKGKENEKYLEFAQLFKFNNSVEAVMTISRGKKNLKDVGRIVELDGSPMIDDYELEKCNVINGTDSVSFPPRQTKENVQYMFFKTICKSLPFEYVSRKRIHGINTLVKEMKWNSPLFDPECNTNEYLENNFKGVLDMHECLEGFTYMTGPHNLLADARFSENIEGLKPDHKKHASQIYMDPLTGVLLRGFIRFQFNVLAKPIDTYPVLSKIREFRLPLNYLEFTYEAPKAVVHKLQVIHTTKTIGNFIGRFTFLMGVVGCMLSIAAVALGIGPETPKILNVVPKNATADLGEKSTEGSASTRADD